MWIRRGIMSLRAAVGLAVAALVILVLVYRHSDRRSEYPDTPEHVRPFMCEQCKHVFELTPKKRVELEKDATYEVPDDRTQGVLLLPCPDCGQKAARDAWRCPHCSEVQLPPRFSPPKACSACGRKPD